MNRVNRHIPTIISKLECRINVFKDRINFYEKRMNNQISIREKCFMQIFDLRHKIKSVNSDIELIHDPLIKPIGSDQEHLKIERLLLSLHAKIKSYEVKIHRLQIKSNESESKSDECISLIDSLTDKCLDYEKQIENYRSILRNNLFVEDGEYLDQEPAIDVEFSISHES